MNQVFKLGDSIHEVETDTRTKKIKDKTLSADLIFKSLVRGVGLGAALNAAYLAAESITPGIAYLPD
jgi:hypothetical protein